MINLTDTEIAWIAGLIEGEGSISIRNRGKDRYEVSTAPPEISIKIAMTDKDVIEKFSKLVDKSYFSLKRKTVTNKTVYQISVSQKEKVIYLLESILPHMGQRRTQRITEALQHLYGWREWVKVGGRSEMAKRGYSARLAKHGTCAGGNPTGINQFTK